MNKKRKTYLLLVLVIGVWGLIGYNIFSYLNPEAPHFEPQIQQQFTVHKETKQKDTLVISNYRDPFLGKIKTNRKNLKTQNTPIINYPTVVYHGIVKGAKVKSYIISVHNQQELVKIGHTFLGVKLISANTKQIIITYKKVKKTIKLQN